MTERNTRFNVAGASDIQVRARSAVRCATRSPSRKLPSRRTHRRAAMRARRNSQCCPERCRYRVAPLAARTRPSTVLGTPVMARACRSRPSTLCLASGGSPRLATGKVQVVEDVPSLLEIGAGLYQLFACGEVLVLHPGLRRPRVWIDRATRSLPEQRHQRMMPGRRALRQHAER